MEDYEVRELQPDESFCFSCTPDVPCFNDCCGDITQYLTPYDILRLKRNRGLSSSEFLARYTSRHIGEQTGLVVVTLRHDASPSKRCPFVTPHGCGVYDDRPSSCRAYPLARIASRSRETGLVTERYLLMKEPHCKGFEGGDTQTVRQWVKRQGLDEYNMANDLMMEIISEKNRLSPGAPLDLVSQKIFYTGCYDLDGFKKEVFETGGADDLDIDRETMDLAASDETALLRVALAWVKKMLFKPA